jgi:hypothetical protein
MLSIPSAARLPQLSIEQDLCQDPVTGILAIYSLGYVNSTASPGAAARRGAGNLTLRRYQMVTR